MKLSRMIRRAGATHVFGYKIFFTSVILASFLSVLMLSLSSYGPCTGSLDKKVVIKLLIHELR